MTYEELKSSNDAYKKGCLPKLLCKVSNIDEYNGTCLVSNTLGESLYGIDELFRLVMEGKLVLSNPSVFANSAYLEKQNRIFVVSACREPYDDNNGVEIAGIFSSSTKAQKAKQEVMKWMESQGYTSAEVFVVPANVNRLQWYSIDKDI